MRPSQCVAPSSAVASCRRRRWSKLRPRFQTIILTPLHVALIGHCLLVARSRAAHAAFCRNEKLSVSHGRNTHRHTMMRHVASQPSLAFTACELSQSSITSRQILHDTSHLRDRCSLKMLRKLTLRAAGAMMGAPRWRAEAHLAQYFRGAVRDAGGAKAVTIC